MKIFDKITGKSIKLRLYAPGKRTLTSFYARPPNKFERDFRKKKHQTFCIRCYKQKKTQYVSKQISKT